MLKINSQYPSRVKYVDKTKTTNDGTPMTKFNVGYKIKDTDPAQYMNFDVTVYADVPLKDGDEVVFTAIDSISSRVYNGKIYHSIVAKIKSEAAPVDDDNEPLPFDI